MTKPYAEHLARHIEAHIEKNEPLPVKSQQSVLEELRRLQNALRVAEESLERCRAVCNATAEQWRADVAATPAPAPQLPQFIRAEVERAIAKAIAPTGMSTHDGKAVIGHDKLRYMLALIDKLAATPAPEPVGYVAAEIYAAWRKVGADVCGLKWDEFIDALRAGQGKEASNG